MFTVKTKDGHDIELTHSRNHPDSPPGGMAPAMSYLYIKTPILIGESPLDGQL